MRLSVNSDTSILEVFGDMDFLNIELKDDDTPEGGIAYEGETLGNFMKECKISPNDGFIFLQKMLKENGIAPLEIFKR